jgi:AcrR family transcriptional regulator
VSALPADPPPQAGLRERKKAKTRAAIQHEALALFRHQGYETTTMEQIAERAEVAVSTVFRYFPAKEDLVLRDEYDPLLAEALAAVLPGIEPVQAVRQALGAVLAGLSAEETADMRDRAALALGVPALRAAMVDQFAQAIRLITELVVKHSDRCRDDFAVHTLAGAIVGVLIAAEFYWFEHPDTDLFALLDEALAQLQSGLAR